MQKLDDKPIKYRTTAIKKHHYMVQIGTLKTSVILRREYYPNSFHFGCIQNEMEFFTTAKRGVVYYSTTNNMDVNTNIEYNKQFLTKKEVEDIIQDSNRILNIGDKNDMDFELMELIEKLYSKYMEGQE